MDIIAEAHAILDIEIEAMQRVRNALDERLIQAIQLIQQCRQQGGKVIVTGMGKSGIIAQKIAATMSSTGTLAVFLHPAEGLHGDIGIVTRNDVLLALSKSGESTEMLGIFPSIRKIGARVIAIVGQTNSSLARNADVVLDASVEREACPINLAPTASTTVTLAMGDAIAAILLKMNNFQPENFALFHPGGSLGKRLLLTVDDLMHQGAGNPVVLANTSMREAVIEMTAKAMGAVNVVDEDNKVVGIVTDGDLRRALQNTDNLLTLQVKEVMVHNPITITSGSMAVKALRLMEERESQIMVLPVVDKEKKLIGILRLHDLVQTGL